MQNFAQAEKKNARRALADRAWSGLATRVEHLSDTLGPVGPLFSHRFQLGKHGFNQCFTRSVPGTGSSIWDPRLVASEFVDSGGPGGEREREKEGTGVWDKWRSEGPGRDGGPGIHAPRLRAHFACQAQFRSGPGILELSLFGAAVYGRHYLDRPRVGLNDLFSRARVLLYWPDVSYVILNVTLIWRRDAHKILLHLSSLNAQLQ